MTNSFNFMHFIIVWKPCLVSNNSLYKRLGTGTSFLQIALQGSLNQL